MLSKARLEESHVKTVSLARGTVTAPGHGSFCSGSTPNSVTRGNLDRSSTAGSNSSDGGLGTHNSKSFGPNTGHPLNSIGIIELFEQDERPTFVVDLSDSANYGPGRVSTLFANAALRSCEGLYESVTGHQDESPAAPGSFIQFKTWLLSASVNGESLNVCLPAFSYANIFWSCTTLRKRLRVISGSFATPPGSRISATPSAPSQSAGSTSVAPTSAAMVDVEPSDYFGSASQPSVSAGPNPIPGASIPTSTAITSTPSISERRISIVDEGSDLDPLLSPLKYVTQRTAHMLPTASALTNVNWFNSHIAINPVATPSFDWTRLPITDSMPPHIQFARSIDWGSTSLGPIDTWGPDLRQMCNLIMASPHPAAMYWGDDLVAIYNEAYIMLAGLKHPALMGQNYSVAWAEIWDDVKDVFANARLTGEATMKDDDGLFIKRSNYLEETYFSWSIIPMVGGDGTVMGLYNPAFEKTRRKIAERRMLTLREIGERTASARDVKGFWAQVMGAFDYNLYDSPFMLLYSVFDEVDSDASSMHSNSTFAAKPCRLEGTLGVPEGHPCAPEHLELRNGTEGFTPVFREVMNTDKPACIEVGTGELPESLIHGLEWRGFGDPCTSVVVCPIHPTTGEAVLGFLVLGVNPRRPYDDDYSLFIQLLSRQLATSLASVVLFEEEIRRGQKAAKLAALDRIELSQQLAARTQEAIESETKFTRMAEFAPVGMFIASSNGNITFANDSWYEISRVPRGQGTADKWIQAVKEEDQQLVEKMWQTLVVDTKPVSFEFRFKAPWQDRRGDRGETWVLFSSYPERDQEGRLKSVFGSITNISEQKWAEGIQTRKMEEAVELKRQQENFIDITSHEMRNPLSAILQCSDEISGSLTQFKNTGSKTLPDELIANCLDAAQTISLCSQHQKRIVDDILTLSKLDSQLLLVTPVDAQPLTVVQRALKMHEGELQAADIQMKFVVDQTFRDMNLDWVRFDPSRVLQVLINLTTNAIKFTTTESKRTITVTIAASNQRPSEMECAPVKYFATRSKKHSMEDKDWGDGERVFIHFSVQDTGRGLSPEEKKLLFMRFSQASPRTHVQYGGSGLGLFISRELTELQGGEIGVESEAGKGSIFAFYVAARRSTAPADDTGINLMHRASDAKGKKDITTMASKDDKQGQAAAPAVPIQKRVLIVEDNLVNQRVLQKQLKALGTEVHLANHGGEALEKLLQSTYCSEGGTLQLGVVLMDQEMPVMDGLTCTRRIRELEREGKIRVHVPIIAVTANARQEQIQTAIDAGMDDVVSKPFRIPDLVPKIEELMGMYPMPDGPSDGSK
jgi:PAS domain S-box-containing protein